MKRFVVRIILSLAALGFSGGGFQAFAQHVHLFCGAETNEPPFQVILVNRVLYDTNSNGGITPECFFMRGGDPLYPGLFVSDATFVALPATLWTGGAAPSHASNNAYLEAKMISVEGPVGGEISLWQGSEDLSETTKIFSQPVGTKNGTNRFNVSEGITYPEPDPFGHIHERQFTANKPGLYTVGFQILDTSTSGPGGGPSHPPSITNYFYFQAGLQFNSMVMETNTVTLKFGCRPYCDYRLEGNTDLSTTNWLQLDEYFGNGHSHIQHLIDTNAIAPARFYRLREIPQ